MNEKLTLEQRLQRLEDIEEIRKLKALYCKYADVGWDGAEYSMDKWAELFTEDVVWDGDTAGRWEGREQLRPLGDKVTKFAIHYMVNPIIEVTGDSATGVWHGLVPMTTPNGKSLLVAGKYEEEYVRTPAGWRIRRLKFHTAFIVKSKADWV
ncbi:MAG: nuclear transport factor 2 family protein [Dehalococcoidia bacterium]|nr:nuclear transport factor 2 family protein [Dehalococcoidia bacterium]